METVAAQQRASEAATAATASDTAAADVQLGSEDSANPNSTVAQRRRRAQFSGGGSSLSI